MSIRDAIINVLECNPQLILDVASEFPEGYRRTRLIPGKWSAQEQLSHLARVEKMMVVRLNGILSRPDQPIAPYDPDKDSPETLADHDWDATAILYRTSRAALVKRLRGIDDNTWRAPLVHPEYPQYSIHILTRHVALHDAFHGYRIEELLSQLVSA